MGDEWWENLLATHKPWSTFWEIEKRSSSFYNGKEGTIWKVMKCLVVSFQKEPECAIQGKLMTSRSLNRRKKKRRRGWTPGRFGTYGSRTDYSIFTMKSHFLVFFFFSFLFNFLSFPFSNFGFLILMSWLSFLSR